MGIDKKLDRVVDDGYVSSHVSVLVRDSCFIFVFSFFSPCFLILFFSLHSWCDCCFNGVIEKIVVT